jgi:hypothetical protein
MAFQGAFYYADPGGFVVDVTQSLKVGNGVLGKGTELISLLLPMRWYTGLV